MADQPGFFEQLVGSATDESSVLDQQIADDIRAGGKQASLAFGLGRQAGGGLGAGILGLINKKAGQRAQDNLLAQANGITPAEVRTRRRIRTETASVVDDGTFSARRKMADIAARIANEEGDGAGLARALAAKKSLDEEEQQFDKLKAQKTTAEAVAVDSQIGTGFTSDGKPVSGVRGIQNGKAGMFTEVNGQLVFKPFNEDFSMRDPTKSDSGKLKAFEIGNELKKNNGVAFVAKIKNLASSANTALAKTDRVLSTLTDLFNEGGVDAVIGTSGRIITSIDNLSRNVNAVINRFAAAGQAADNKPGLTPSGETRSFAGRKGLIGLAADAANAFSEIIQLPEGIERTSAAAQQHRAAVMEMAYMAARLAEPSNRGLSDNDIKNALARIAGNTSNPQVMMRRFLEMQVDAANELDFELSLAHGSLGPDVSDKDIDRALVGDGFAQYKSRKDKLFSKFGVVTQGDGRVTFADGFSLGTDVQPGEGVDVAAPPVDQTDSEFLDGLLGPKS